MDLVREAQKFDDTIHFEIGQPDLPPPPKVKSAIEEAVKKELFAYTPTQGLNKLQEKISNHYKKVYNLEIAPERILITPGTSIAFLIAYELLLNQNSTIAMADPSYPCYKNFAYMVDANPLLIPVFKKQNYLIRSKDLERLEFDALHISTPSNPTGSIYKSKDLKEVVEFCQEKGVGLISDELYQGLVYDEVAPTALEFGDDVIVINGFSKYFCMSGLRIGWMVLPPKLIRPAEIIAQNLYISAPTLSQYGALEAFDYNYLAKVKETFRQRRDFLFNELSKIFDISIKPEGAFYIWCDISKYSNNSLDFSYQLLEDIHIAVTPGADFGKNETNRYLRFSYTRDINHLKEGIERLKRYLKV